MHLALIAFAGFIASAWLVALLSRRLRTGRSGYEPASQGTGVC